MKRWGVITAIFATLAFSGAAAAQPRAVTGFAGHNCTISSCRYFTSSYRTARYRYDRDTCSQWKSLSRKYLNGFNTVKSLHNHFPKRVLHPPC
jgi:hypothetical protein